MMPHRGDGMPDVWQFFESVESTAFLVSNLSHFLFPAEIPVRLLPACGRVLSGQERPQSAWRNRVRRITCAVGVG